ncbi:MAG: hypothetical protein MUO39_07035 [Steroidobacteraceae bacterium]|nr:hypothetical protein [Steroidobacteraceae bacterium]
MPTLLRSLFFASLIGLVALPAMAEGSGAADRSQGSDALQQAMTSAGTGREDASGTGLDKSYSWDQGGVQQAAMVSLPDEHTGPLQTMTQIALALLMMVMIALGLTITFTSLGKDMKQRRRAIYRPRGPPRAGA